MSPTPLLASGLELDALLTDAGIVHIRGARPDDAEKLRVMYAGASEDTLYLRFFSASHTSVDDDIHALCRPADSTHVVLVAESGDRLVGYATFERLDADPTRAEVAFFVPDTEQGRGIGTLLFEHLVALGIQHGVREFLAEVLPENVRMLNLIRDLGLPNKASLRDGVIHVRIPLVVDEKFRRAVDRREALANSRSLERLFNPATTVVVGAGANPAGLGHQILVNIVRGGYRGRLFAVNRSGTQIAGVPAYPSLTDVPERPELVIVAVPAHDVLDVARQAAARRAAGLVVISAGFAEAGPEGRARQEELVRICRHAGMRLVGPNCMGLANTAPDVALNATFCATSLRHGGIGFMSQSGAIGIAALEHAARTGVGISTFVSVGNKADVSGNDMLCLWEAESQTRVCTLYLESFGNPRKFSRIARRVGHSKPIVAVKAGRTVAGSRSAASHTAAAATPDIAVDSLFRQAGVTRADSLEELFEFAKFFDLAPLPRGGRVAIVGNSGGPGVLAADACEAAGLEVPELSVATQAQLAAILPPGAAVINPVDVLAGADGATLEKALRIVLRDPGVDAVVVVYTEVRPGSIPEAARALAAVASNPSDKPIVVCFLGHSETPAELIGRSGRPLLPVYAFPEPAVRTLAAARRYADWRSRPPGTFQRFEDVDEQAARHLVETVLSEHPAGRWLDAVDAARLLTAYGIPVVETVEVANAEEAVKNAERMGYPVVLKAGGGDLVHKTERGAIRLDLRTAIEVADAYRALAETVSGPIVVQPMVSSGVEAALGVVNDPVFGPLVMVGLGGVASDLLADRAFRLVPLTVEDADEQIRSLRAAPLFFGYRNMPPVDVQKFREMLLRLAEMASSVPEIAELDLNPVMVRTDGAVTVDAKIRLAPASHEDPYVRRLR
ncbi:MAG: GNAT family N-acetyltransferase [Acidothermus sp.]|nr:GNAT family N-acetyltransferase [Acidothermus sp.]